jgi:hypothetical protein
VALETLIAIAGANRAFSYMQSLAPHLIRDFVDEIQYRSDSGALLRELANHPETQIADRARAALDYAD